MARNQRTLLRRLLPTSHKLLLDRLVQPRLKQVTGDVLVIGAGKETYRSLMPASKSICCTDIEEGETVDIIADAHDLPFPDHSFDTVVAVEVFEHLHDPSKAMAEVFRVLREDGRVVLTIPFMFHVHGDPYDYQRYTASGLKVLVGNRFKFEIQAFGNRFHVISDLVSTAFKSLAVLRVVNHLLCVPFISWPSIDSPSGYLFDLRKLND